MFFLDLAPFRFRCFLRREQCPLFLRQCFQLSVQCGQLLPIVRQSFFSCGNLLFLTFLTFLRSRQIVFQDAQFRASARKLALLFRKLGRNRFRRLPTLFQLLGNPVHILLRLAGFFLRALLIRKDLLFRIAEFRQRLVRVFDVLRQFFPLFLQSPLGLVAVLATFLQHLDFRVLLIDLLLLGAALLEFLPPRLFQLDYLCRQRFLFGFQRHDFRFRRRFLLTARLKALGNLLFLRPQLRLRTVKLCNLAAPELTVPKIELLRFFRRLRQRAKLLRKSLLDVPQPDEILFRLFQLLHGRNLAIAEFRNTRRLLEEKTPLLGAAVQHRVHLVLADDAESVAAKSRIRQCLVNILQMAFCVVQQKFAVAGTENPPRNHDFVKIAGQIPLVQKRQRDLCGAQRAALRAACENDVLGLRPAQVPHIPLAQHPTDRVRDIALAAAVRPDNSRHAVIKLNLDFIRKGFEAMRFQSLQLQNFHQPVQYIFIQYYIIVQ